MVTGGDWSHAVGSCLTSCWRVAGAQLIYSSGSSIQYWYGLVGAYITINEGLTNTASEELSLADGNSPSHSRN